MVWTEDNGGHWIVGNYELVAAAFRDWETLLVGAPRSRPLGDRLHQQQPPAVPPRGERPAALVRLPARARADPLAAGLGATARHAPATGPQHALDQVVETGEIEFVHDLTCPVPASVTLEWLGYPQDEWQWFSDTFHGISAYPAGSPEHHEASKAYGPVLARIDEELRDRIASPRDDALTAIAHHEVDGERLPEDIAQSIAFLTTVGGIDTTTALAGGALLHLSQFPADRRAADRRARAAPARHRGVPALLSPGARPQAHRRGRHRVRRRHHAARATRCS